MLMQYVNLNSLYITRNYYGSSRGNCASIIIGGSRIGAHGPLKITNNKRNQIFILN